MAIVMDYIAKCGCRIPVDDSAYANQPPEVIERRMREVNRCIDGIRWRYAERLVRAQMAEEQARKEAGG